MNYIKIITSIAFLFLVISSVEAYSGVSEYSYLSQDTFQDGQSLHTFEDVYRYIYNLTSLEKEEYAGFLLHHREMSRQFGVRFPDEGEHISVLLLGGVLDYFFPRGRYVVALRAQDQGWKEVIDRMYLSHYWNIPLITSRIGQVHVTTKQQGIYTIMQLRHKNEETAFASGVLIDSQVVVAAKHTVLGVNPVGLEVVDNQKGYGIDNIIMDDVYDIAFIFLTEPASDSLILAEHVVLGEHVQSEGVDVFSGEVVVNEGQIIGVDRDTILVDVQAVPGMSGGPVFNSNHEVVGILSYIDFSRGGVSVVVPGSIVRSLWKSALSQNNLHAPLAGVSLGVYGGYVEVVAVEGESPLQVGDVLLRYNGVPIYGDQLDTLRLLRSNLAVSFDVFRAGTVQRVWISE